MLGQSLVTSAPSDIELLSFTHEQLDITESKAVAATFDWHRPGIVINASGYTAVDRAESDRAGAFAVNSTAVTMLGVACKERDIPVVHFSTDYVFDGAASRPYREDDAACPINCYGASKLAGEQGLLSSGATSLLIRTQWLFGGAGVSFARRMWERARCRHATRVVDDQRGRPTSTADLAFATWQLIEQRRFGLFHIASGGEATWYDVATFVFAQLGVAELVRPCKTIDIPRPARRPAYSVLDTTRADYALGSGLPLWKEALGRLLDALADSDSASRC